MCRLNAMVYMLTKCLGSMFKFNVTVNCITKNCPNSIPKFSVQAQFASSIWHTLGNAAAHCGGGGNKNWEKFDYVICWGNFAKKYIVQLGPQLNIPYPTTENFLEGSGNIARCCYNIVRLHLMATFFGAAAFCMANISNFSS